MPWWNWPNLLMNSKEKCHDEIDLIWWWIIRMSWWNWPNLVMNSKEKCHDEIDQIWWWTERKYFRAKIDEICWWIVKKMVWCKRKCDDKNWSNLVMNRKDNIVMKLTGFGDK